MESMAFIFDMDGTLIDNMDYHYDAWQKIVGELHGNLEGEALRKQLYGKNEEVLGRIFGTETFNAQQLEEISEQKEVYYRELYKPHMKLMPGLEVFLEAAYMQNIPMAVGTASYLRNIDLMLDTLHVRKYFKALVSAGDVSKSKPDPQTFLLAAERLGVPANRCIVFEDVPKGVEAAANAGMKAVVVTTHYQAEDFKGFDNVICIIHDFRHLSLADLGLEA
jgi:beta-phosphoglucomutase family hydrolase